MSGVRWLVGWAVAGLGRWEHGSGGYCKMLGSIYLINDCHVT